MGKADTLSRMTGLETGVNDNQYVTLLKPEFFINQIFGNPEDDIIKRIKNAIGNVDKSVTQALISKDNDWVHVKGDVITWKNRIYVPKDNKLRSDIIKKHHDVITAGHPGQFKTWELVTRNY